MVPSIPCFAMTVTPFPPQEPYNRAAWVPRWLAVVIFVCRLIASLEILVSHINSHNLESCELLQERSTSIALDCQSLHRCTETGRSLLFRNPTQ